ncbi:MAG: vWA domain-containing protein, partial [Pseudomonadota bacterium]
MIPSLSLLRPEWLLALIPLTGFGWWALRIRTGLGDWEQAAKPELLKAMHSLGLVDQQASRGSTMAVLVSAAFIILALSGPAVERRDTPSFRNLDAVIFVLDASHSMIEHSNWPKLQALGRFAISAMGTRPGALIVFGGDAYIATDLTTDLRQLGQTFSLVDGETVPDPGSRPERGLALAAQILADARILNGDVILMTDREAVLGPSMAEAIMQRGARLS